MPVSDNQLTMKEITIYGHSDDLIEIVGDMNDEIYADYGEPTVLTIGGWAVRAEYDGEWNFEVISDPDTSWTHLSVGESDEYNGYTEVLRIDVVDDAEIEKQ